ncbi:FixH family protein [Marivirga sp. S37H4]|uniref:FixH family protein n=1 Tax=Marivirga aurantiaca TaxID=2802615 RepID=A0A934X0T6_9BACT|nr:FixH family protein [Marivirga aurantiaca]MBK6266853.1 FixH family protein [Marivirga aurantiaca]
MNWGNKIVVVFSLFVLLIITLVTISFNQEVNLVAEDYYEEEIAYQGHMAKVKNAQNWEPPINIEQQKDNLYVYFEGADEVKGKVVFFRPSDSKMDFEIALAENNMVPIEKFEHGLWQVDMSWEKDGKFYHKEERIFIKKQ